MKTTRKRPIKLGQKVFRRANQQRGIVRSIGITKIHVLTKAGVEIWPIGEVRQTPGGPVKSGNEALARRMRLPFSTFSRWRLAHGPEDFSRFVASWFRQEERCQSR